jgi:hypothetical protein
VGRLQMLRRDDLKHDLLARRDAQRRLDHFVRGGWAFIGRTSFEYR